jgi:hypothetical protein
LRFVCGYNAPNQKGENDRNEGNRSFHGLGFLSEHLPHLQLAGQR